ncbi:LysR substrate-binding domain-containing protein [Granulosicoccus sp. 3-233]|uniref:LysR substrate-binding domain-containing protein n=1 Tax=Granulosicoccus sp. 3-233 TaxID=3417969 RepID=UPI003D3348E5
MQDLNDLYYFVQVVNHGSFAAAGRALGVPKSTLSRRILALEERVGIRLIQRSTRKLAVTEIGQEYHRHCVAMLVEAEAAQEVIDRSRSEPQGLIRLSAPPALICFELGPMIARYMAAYPLVRVELDATSRRVDLIGEGVDVAIRVRFPPFEDSDLAMRVLGDSSQRIVACPAVIDSLPTTICPADLANLPSMDLDRPGREHVWELNGPQQAQVRIQHQPRLITDDMSQLLHAAIAGVGVVQLPSMVAQAEIQAGRIVDLLPQWRPLAGSVQAIFPSRRGLLPSIRSLIDFLVKEYAARPAEPV